MIRPADDLPVLSHELVLRLLDEGLIPDECLAVRLEMGEPDSFVKLHYSVQLTGARLARFARAFAAAAGLPKPPLADLESS